MKESILSKRVIPCLDVDGGRVVKGTEFVDVRDVGDPVEMARYYETEGADELVFLDITATSGQRALAVELARDTAAKVFIPFTVGGGVRSETDVQVLLDAGADKVAINSAALAEPALLDRLAARFGRQCVVLAIDAKRDENSNWEVYAAGGRISTGRKAVEWAQDGARRGAGEILLTSIDRDGTNAGYDLNLIKTVSGAVNVPVIASGGAGRHEHYVQAIREAGAEAVLAASQLHSGKMSIAEVKAHLMASGVAVRPIQRPAAQRLEPIGPGVYRPRIALVDYGSGNRYSVQKALERVGADAAVTDSPEELAAADGVVLPGVGAFGPAMQRLNETGLGEAMRRLAGLGKPILGICLGEQLLFNGSHEQGWCRGLGLIEGMVQEIELPTRPNIGWRQVSVEQPEELAANVPDMAYFYHLHQYAAAASCQADVVASTHLPYVGNPGYQVPTIVRHGNVYGTQFHPEKSSVEGLSLLKNFVNLCLTSKTGLQ
jgi:cyclase